MSRDVVVIHASDVHVDAHTGNDPCRDLRRVLDTARALAADAVLLAGDTFESQRQPAALLDAAMDLIASSRIPVVLLPGNHDPLLEGSVYHRMTAARPPGFHVLGLTAVPSVIFPELSLEVWGRAHLDYADMNPFGEAPPRRTRWRIAMAHGQYVTSEDRRDPLHPSWLIGDEEIAAIDADYVALGHWNRWAEVGPGAPPAFYSGSPGYVGTVNVVSLSADGGVTVRRQPLQQSAER